MEYLRVFLTLLPFCLDVACGQISYSIAEEITVGTTVGNLAKDLNLNLHELEPRMFQIMSGYKKKYFEVNLKTGVLFVNDRIDREQLCSQAQRCALELEAVAQQPMNLYRVEINILDINDNSPVFPDEVQHLNVSESALPGVRFPLLPAHDPDVGSNAVKSYKLNPNDNFSLDVHNGGEHSVSVELVLQKPLDREKQAAIQLLLTAVDGGKPSRSSTLQIAVNVLDTNDNTPVFSQSLYKVSIYENAPHGSHVVKLNATDMDYGLNGEILYSFSGHVKKNILNIFVINSTSGEITVKGNVDYEENSAFEIHVQAQDRGLSPMASHCKVLVEVIDVNDNSPEIVLTSLSTQVKEDAPDGTPVAFITVSDRDSGKNGNVKCSLSAVTPFMLKSTYKNYYSVVTRGLLDRETASQYNITFKATDEGIPPLSTTSVITVYVSDVNDNEPRFLQAEFNVYIKENSPVGTLIHTVTAFDEDDLENSRITYSLLGGNIKDVAPSTVININSVTGEIYALQTFNYEEMKMFQFRVQATDSGVPPLSSNVTVNVFILDENDNRPGILAPYSEQGSVNTESIPYSAEAGYFVAKIRAVDADSGYNALLSYHMSEPKGSNLFRIGSGNGEIRTKRRMSDNDLRTHPLVIVVCDSGEPSLSATVSVDVLVVESSGETQTSFGQRPSKEESFSDLNVYLLIAIVSVCVIFVLSLIGVVAVKCHRTEEDFSSYGAPVITTHPDGSWSYSKSTQQYDVCFSSDTLKSDVVVFPAPCGPTDAELISINGGDTFKRNQTLPSRDKVRLSMNNLMVFK